MADGHRRSGGAGRGRRTRSRRGGAREPQTGQHGGPVVADTPRRTCVGCRRTSVITDLVRLARAPDGSVVASRTLGGRGAWLCRGSDQCALQAARSGALPRAFRASVDVTADDVRRLVLHPDPAATPSPT